MSLKASFNAVARRIEAEKCVKHVGTASVRLDVLLFDRFGDLDQKNVERLKRLFQKGGCFPGQFANRIPALIHADALRESLALSGLSADQLRSRADEPDGHARLELPTGLRLTCLRGRHRVAAAADVLGVQDKRWVVDLFLADSSEDLRYVLRDEYANEHNPDDGVFFFQIRQHQGIFGPRNRYFENRWWARLSATSTSTNKIDRLRQLYRHREFGPAFDAFRTMPALYYGLRLSVVNKMISMGCQEELLAFLEHTRDFWYDGVFGKDEEAMRKLDPDTVKEVQLKAPGACEADRQELHARVTAGAIFSAFGPDERQRLWQNLCAASTRCLAPSLFAFFENVKYLKGPLDCMKRLVRPERGISICASLERSFQYPLPASGQCLVQSSPSTCLAVSVEPQDHFRLAYLQLWLYALREYRHMPPATKKKLATPDATVANEHILYEFASLARKLGFVTDAIEDLLQHNPDRAIASRLLLAARNPEQYRYPDLQHCITQITEVVATARLLARDDAPDDDTSDCLVRAPYQLVNRSGIPKDGHQRQDRPSLFLTKMLGAADEPMQSLTSFFVQRSIFFAFFTGAGRIRHDYLADVNRAVESELWTDVDRRSRSEAPSNAATPGEALGANLQSLTAQLQEHQERHAQLEAAIVEKQAILHETEHSQQDWQRRVQQLKDEEAATAASLRSLQTTKESLSSVVDQLQRDSGHLQNEKEAHDQELRKLKAQVEAIEQELMEKTHQATEKTHQEEGQTTRIHDLTLREQNLQAQIQDLQNAKDRQAEELNRLRATEHDLQKSIEELRQDVARYDEEKEKRRESNIEYGKKVKSVTKQMRDFENRAKKAKSEEEAIRARIQEKEATLNAIEAQTQEKKAALNAIEAQTQEKEAALNAIEAQTQEKEAALNAIEAQTQEKEAALNAILAQTQEKGAALNAILAQTQEKEAALNAIQEQTREQKALINMIQSIPENKRNDLNALVNSIQKLTMDEAALRSKMQELAAAAGPVGEDKVCIVFRKKVDEGINVFTDDVTDVLTVDASEPMPVERVAAKYVRKHHGLFDHHGRNMTPANCFQRVTGDGSYTIYVRHGHAVEVQSEEVGRNVRARPIVEAG